MMKTVISTINNWSILGQGPSVLVVVAQTVQDPVVLDRARKLLIDHGAVIERANDSGFDCQVPVRRFLGFIYRKTLTIPCSVRLQTETESLGATLVARCDLSKMRKAKRIQFYGLSLFVVAVATAQYLRGEWSPMTWLAFGIPWVIVEGNLVAERARLRAKLVKLLEAASTQ